MTNRRAIDINCDMGEGFGHWRIAGASEADLLKLVSSASVATGFHAGDPNLMDDTVRLAVEHGVRIGAHPGFRDLQGFGRRSIDASADELVNDVVYQIGALREFTRRYGVHLQHVKPHGALYMDAARNEKLSRALIDALQKIDPELFIYCMGASVTYQIARSAGQPVAREFYADREYDRTGSIVFVRSAGMFDPRRVADRAVRACLDGKVTTVDGDDIDIEFESICFHSDTPGAMAIGEALRGALVANGIRITPVGDAAAG